jgi:argininosuccinate lyase
MSFRMQTVVENPARIALDRIFITLRLPELEYLLLNLTALANQLALFTTAEADVFVYLQSSAGAASFVPPPDSVCLFVQHDVLFAEINGYL